MLSEYEYGFMEALNQMHLRYIEIEKLLADMPSGSVERHKVNGKYYYYCCSYADGKRMRRYLCSDDSDPILSEYENKHNNKKSLQNEKKILKQRLLTMRRFVFDIYRAGANTEKIPFPSLPSEKQRYSEGLIYPTAHGELVRSKSEVMICNALYELGVPYHYEKHWNFGPDFCPDFTIKSPLNGKTVILEHLGMNDDRYSRSWDYKKGIYDSRNIIEGRDLFITTEENIPHIKTVLGQMFTCRRYENLVNFLKQL